MPIFQWSRRTLAWAGIVGAFALGLPARADAGVEADFDRDGLADAITVFDGLRVSEVHVDLSGPEPSQILRIEGHLLSLVAADLDRDGDNDLAAMSAHGLTMWRNVRHGALEQWRQNGKARRYDQQVGLHARPSSRHTVYLHQDSSRRGLAGTHTIPRVHAIDPVRSRVFHGMAPLLRSLWLVREPARAPPSTSL